MNVQRTIAVKKSEDYRLYLLDTGDLAKMIYANDDYVVMFELKWNGEYTSKTSYVITPLAMQKRETGNMLTLNERNYTVKLNNAIIDACYDFVNV